MIIHYFILYCFFWLNLIITRVMQPLVSILFPCYNAEKYLRYSLESILNQNYKNLEIICINDGSSDGTLRTLEAYQKKDSRIVIVDNKSNIGLINSLNNGLKFITGNYFARMDADDYSTPDRISIQVNFMESNKEVDLVSTGYNYFTTDGQKSEYVAPIARKSNSLMFLSLFSTPLTHAAVLGKTSLITSGQYIYDINYPHAEDYELFSRLAWNGVKIATLEKSLYWVRIHPGSVSAIYNDVQFQTNLKIIQRNIHDFLKLNIELEQEVIGLLACRIKSKVSIKKIRQAFSTFDLCLKSIGERFTQEELSEINSYLSNHRLNIIIQANKIGFKGRDYRQIPFFVQSLCFLNARQLGRMISKILNKAH
jgi:glycosyltransferase involved in cell wall biosynthesis